MLPGIVRMVRGSTEVSHAAWRRDRSLGVGPEGFDFSYVALIGGRGH